MNWKKNLTIKMAGAILAGTFNAFAFAGAGFLFSKINKGDYEKEMKRHNAAMEKLAKEREIWNEARLKEIDRIQNLRYNKQESLRDISDTNKDLIHVESKFAKTEPQLSDFYKPSPKMNEYMNVVKLLGTIPVLYGVAALIL